MKKCKTIRLKSFLTLFQQKKNEFCRHDSSQDWTWVDLTKMFSSKVYKIRFVKAYSGKGQVRRSLV
jgi:hypothetical protein